MKAEEIKNYRKAGSIVKQVKEFARTYVKKDMSLLEIAETIEDKIVELGGSPAFPTTLGINEVAAHFTPSHDGTETAHGLIKVDFGVAVEGFSADNSFTLDLEDLEENKKLIEASEKALLAGIKAAKDKLSLGEIGESIQKTAEDYNFSPIKNLSGHSIEEFNLHAGITIPNFNNGNPNKLEDGAYAIEPFITPGVGEVTDGKPAGIYELIDSKNVRDPKSRELLEYIDEEYGTLPFCARWLVKKFGTRALISLRNLEQAEILHHFSELIEKSRSKVAQSEATILIVNGEVEVITQ